MREKLSSGVDFLNRFGQSFCNFAGTMLVQVTILVAVLLVLELLLRNRVRAVVRYWLWLLVLVKLVLPINLHTPVSLAYWLPAARPHSEPAQSAAAHGSAVSSVARPTQFATPADEPEATSSRTEFIPFPSRHDRPTAAPTMQSDRVVQPALEVPSLQWRGALFGLWIVGVASLLTIVARRAVWVRRLVRQATPASSELQQQLLGCLLSLNLANRLARPPSPIACGEPVEPTGEGRGEGKCASDRRRIAVKISNHLNSPAICGLWRPTILLPSDFPGSLDREQVRMVFIHELVHWRRGDLVVNSIQTLLQILYFYNPAVWLANLIIRRLREQAVDETVLVAAGGQPDRYASTLLDLAAAPLASIEATLRLTGVIESRRALSTRIRQIMSRSIPRSSKIGVGGIAAVAACAALLLPMGRPEQVALANEKSTSDTSDHPSTPEQLQSPTSSTQPAVVAAEMGKDIDRDVLPRGAIARLGSKRFRSSRATPVALCFLPDNKTLVQMTQDGWLQHWDAQSGRLLSETHPFDFGFTRDVRLSRQSGLATACAWTQIQENERANRLLVFRLVSGERLLEMRVNDRNKSVRATDQQLDKRQPRERELPIEHSALCPDGRTVAYGRDNVHLVDVRSQTEIENKCVECKYIESLVFSPNGKTLAIGTHDGRLVVWNWTTDEKPRSIPIAQNPQFGPYPVWCFEFSPDGAKLAVVNGNHDFENISLFDTANWQVADTIQTPGEARSIHALEFSPDGKQIYSSSEGGAALWDVANGNLIRRLHGLFGKARFLAFSPDRRWLAASSQWDSTMCVWNVETGEPIRTAAATHMQPPSLLRFLPGDKQLATAGHDGTIRVWNLADSRQVRMMEHSRGEWDFNGDIRGLDASPDGKYIASSSNDDTLRLWEMTTGREVFRLPGHGHLGGYRSVRFTPDGKQFASWGDDDMRVNIWDVRTGKAAHEFLVHPAGLNMQRDGLGNPPFSGMGFGPRLEAATISSDASTLILLLDGLRRFSIPSGEELPWWGLKGGTGDQIAISNDNRHLLSATWGVRSVPGGQREAEKHAVELRTVADGKILAHIDVDGPGAGPMAFSPDGHLAAIVAIGERNRIELRKIPELSEIARIELPSRAWGVEFSHSGKLLAVSVADSTVLVWDVENASSAVQAISLSASSSPAIR